MFTLCIAKSGRERPSLFFQGKGLIIWMNLNMKFSTFLNKKKIKKWVLNSLAAVEMHKNCSNKYMPLTLMK